MEWILAAAVVILAAALIITLFALKNSKNADEVKLGFSKTAQELAALSARQDMLLKSNEPAFERIQKQLHEDTLQTEQKLDNMRRLVADSLARLSQENNVQLENIRKTVDEKLQTALEKKLNDSFKQVSERLEQVYRGLGEMQTLAVGVGDLKKVLSNVKTRGVLGEIQLGAILEQILSPEQYEKNVTTRPGSATVVEYAVKLPGEDGKPVWLPIDAKFPADAYEQLINAYDSADQAKVDAALKLLRDRVRAFARDIHQKYISPPNTTEFGIMFLPVEGLYAEVVRCGLVEQLQQEFKVNIAGPTTMGALLNSLQMGFRTLAIQKRSGEVWQVLGSVKTEFDKFADVLEATQKRLTQANDELDKLVGVRTRQIQSKLRNVQSLPEAEVQIEE